jgi:hypothetical protein
MPLLEAGIGSLLTWTSVRSLRRREVVLLGLSAPMRERPSSTRKLARSADAWHFARELPRPEPRAMSRRAVQAADAACERALNGLANGP